MKKRQRREMRSSAIHMTTSNELGSKDTKEGLEEFGEMIGM